MGFFDIFKIEYFVLLVTVLVLVWFYVRQKWKYFEKMGIDFVEPKFRELGSATPLFTDLFYEAKCKEKHGPVFGVYMMTTPLLTVLDPEILRQIFIKEFRNFSTRTNQFKKSGRELNLALTDVEGEQWKRTRSTITPIFSSFKLKQMHAILNDCADRMLNRLEKYYVKENKAFAAKEVFGGVALDVVLSAVFNTQSDDNTKNGETESVIQAKKFFDINFFKSPMILLLMLFPKLESLTSKLGVTIFDKGGLDYFKNLSIAIMKRRKEFPKEAKRIDVMQLMLDTEIAQQELKDIHAGKGLTHDEIIGNAILMILAGYENTANTIGFLAYNLAVHPEIQKRLQEEIDTIVGDSDDISYSALQDMKYLEMCLNESMRIYCPVLRNARICTNDTVIKGIIFKKGMTVNIPTQSLHRDPEFWDEPLEFRPDRMEDMTKVDPMVFQPFGAGPRNCVALRFAKIEVKLILAKMLLKYNILPTEDTPPPPLELTFKASILPKEPLHFKLEKRNL